MTFVQTGFFSHALGMCVSCDVLMPHRAAPTDGYPVLWLLHGACCDRTDWIARTGIVHAAEAAHWAVVMPDAHDSAYADMVYGQKYCTYIGEELPIILRDFFALSPRREDNAVLGCSMGGEGSMKLGFAYPQQYGAIGCLSAGIRNRSPLLENDPLWRRRMALAYGDDRDQWPEEATFEAARRIAASGAPCPRIYHACGQDDFLLDSAHETRDFFQSFPDNPFGYTYEEDPGKHNWNFWSEHLNRFIQFIS